MNTIEEKSEKAWLDYEYRADGNLYSTCFRDGYIQGATEALSHQWISVEEALPEDNKKVLFICEYGSFMGYFNPTTSMWFAIGLGEVPDVTYWMPIPPLPEARKDE